MKWTNPLQRSYQDIKNKLIDSLKLNVPEITDYSEGNIFVILINLFSSIAEVLHFYIDNMARETFFTTARRYSSLVKHAKLVDYHILSAIPSMVDVNAKFENNQPIPVDFTIPQNTEFISSDGQKFTSSKTVLWAKGTYSVNIPLVQKELVESKLMGIIDSSESIIGLGDLGNKYYAEGSMNLSLHYGSTIEPWTLVETFAYSKPSDTHYKVELNDDFVPVIIFGNGLNGKKPKLGSYVYCSYYVTNGELGNIPENSITTTPQLLLTLGSIKVNNKYEAVSGSNYENFDSLKVHVPLSIKHLGVAITKDDYEDLVKCVPGVSKAYVNYICGKVLDIYITPDGGGLAPQALIDSVYEVILKKKVITTKVNVLPVNISEVFLEANITGNRGYRATDIYNQVVKALIESYSYNESDIGKKVRLSDLYAIIDNQSLVNYLYISNLYLKPTPVSNNTNTILNISYYRALDVKSNLRLSVVYNSDSFEVFDKDNGKYLGSCQIDEALGISYLYNRFEIIFSNPLTGLYSNGDSWDLSIVPNNVDLISPDLNMPVILKDNLKLTIVETV